MYIFAFYEHYEDSLEYTSRVEKEDRGHSYKTCLTQQDLSLAYSLGRRTLPDDRRERELVMIHG